jgi:hypothetical protein
VISIIISQNRTRRYHHLDLPENVYPRQNHPHLKRVQREHREIHHQKHVQRDPLHRIDRIDRIDRNKNKKIV